jgi:Ribosomal protein L11 methyltransferase (PrmA)
MDIKCRCRGKCIKAPPEILKKMKSAYYPCESCAEWNFKKFIPLKEQLDPAQKIDGSWGRCLCGRRHLDVVMAHILKIMQEEGLKDEESTLRQACIPMITPAYPLKTVPYLQENSLVILSAEMTPKCAEKIFGDVPEVKGVLKGNLKNTVGIKESKSPPVLYQLLAGCDMRCDLFQTPSGPLFIYKHQGEIHVEFPKPASPKISALTNAMRKYVNPKVLDCTCGPGTLGIAALKGGASRVVFNDLWYPAAQTTTLNLQVNGFPIELSGHKHGLIASGENWDVYCLDIKDLDSLLNEKFDLCLVDPFPGVEPESFVEAVQSICKEVIVIYSN